MKLKFREVLILINYLVFVSALVGQSTHKVVQTKRSDFNEFENSDSLFLVQEKRASDNLEKGDTVQAIKYMLETARISSTMGRYAQSYDCYWAALILANNVNDSIYTPSIYTGLGTLYSVFGRDKEAEKYFNSSLNFFKNKKLSSKLSISNLRNTYYVLASHNRENGDNGIAQRYLDTCKVVGKTNVSHMNQLLVSAEQAYVYMNQGEFEQSIHILESLESQFAETLPSYQVVLFSMMGEVYYYLRDYSNSEKYLQRSLAASSHFKSHQNYIPEVYQKLGDLYVKMGKMTLAYESLQKSKDLTEQFFGVRSQRNSDVLEIKDSYRIEREHQKKVLESARLNELEQQQKILFLRNLTLSISFVFILFLAGIFVWNLYRRRKSEHAFYKKKQKLSEEKNAEIVEFKNKELTSSALQVIQKDELILEIKEALLAFKGENKKEVNSILTKIKVNKSYDWTEFDARFTSVNKAFYKTLSTQYPDLTQRDHKLCALIKLNFSSKEISQLLGISMESVNTARYRLRKKMVLEKDEDLSEFIAHL